MDFSKKEDALKCAYEFQNLLVSVTDIEENKVIWNNRSDHPVKEERESFKKMRDHYLEKLSLERENLALKSKIQRNEEKIKELMVA